MSLQTEAVTGKKVERLKVWRIYVEEIVLRQSEMRLKGNI